MDQFASPDEAVGVATSAFLALVGYNRDGAESDCLLSRLRFTDAVGNVWAMGCRMETETQKKCCSKKTACLVSDPVTDTSFTAMPCHRCPPGHSYEDAEGRHYQPVKPMRSITDKMALQLMNTQWESAPSEWWKFLGEKLTEHPVCDHVRAMLQEPARVTRTTFTKIWDPALNKYEAPAEEQLAAQPLDVRALRGCPGEQQCITCLFRPDPNKSSKDPKNKFYKGECYDCKEAKKREQKRLKRAEQKAQRMAELMDTPVRQADKTVYSPFMCESYNDALPPPPPPPKPAPADTTTPSKHAALGSFAQCCGTIEEHAEHEERIRSEERRRAQNTLDHSKSRAAHKLQQAQQSAVDQHRESEAAQAELAEQLRQKEEALRQTQEQLSALKHRYDAACHSEASFADWEAFIASDEAVAALEADMLENGLHFTVPRPLRSLYEGYLRAVFFVEPGEEDTKTAVRAKSVLVSAGFHFFSSILGRKGSNRFSTIQTQMAINLKAGMIETVLKDMNEAGWAASGRTADRALDAATAQWQRNLGIRSDLSVLCWIDNFETIIWHLYFGAKQADYEHEPVPTGGGLPEPTQERPSGCQCGPNRACQTNHCDCAKEGHVCLPGTCNCACTVFADVFAAQGPAPANPNAKFLERQTEVYDSLPAAQRSTFNPVNDTAEHGLSGDRTSHDQVCLLAGAVSNIDDTDTSWTRADLQRRLPAGQRQPQDITLEHWPQEDLTNQPAAREARYFARVAVADETITASFSQAQSATAAAATLSKLDAVLSAAYEAVHGVAPQHILQRTDTDSAILSAWIDTYNRWAMDDTVRRDVKAKHLCRRFLKEHTSLRDPAEVNLRAQCDQAVMRIVTQHWDGRWYMGGAPAQCRTCPPELWKPWCRLYQTVTGRSRAPGSFRKLKSELADTDAEYVAVRRRCQSDTGENSLLLDTQGEQLDPATDATNGADEDEVAEPPTYRLTAFTPESASSHSGCEKHTRFILETVGIPEDGAAMELPWKKPPAASEPSAPVYKHPSVGAALAEEAAEPQDEQEVEVEDVSAAIAHPDQAEPLRFGRRYEWSAPAPMDTDAGDAVVQRADLPREFYLCTDFAILKYIEARQAEHGEFSAVKPVPALLHYVFAGCDTIVRKHFDLLKTKDILRESLNITSDAQERYVLEPTADVRKLLRAWEQYAIAIGVRAVRHFKVSTLDELITHARALDRQVGGEHTHVLLQELDFVADYLIVADLFHGGHDGDHKRVMAALIQLAPLLWETDRPNKSEEILSHLYRLSGCCRREYVMVTQRCLFQKYRGGEKVQDHTPTYNSYGDSEGAHRFVLNDENGEDLIGKMKVSGAHSRARILREAKLYNYLQKAKRRNHRKRHKSSAATFADKPSHLACVANMLEQLGAVLPPARGRRAASGHYDRAVAVMQIALQRRLTCVKKPMHYKDSARTVRKSYRQMVADLKWAQAQAPRAGSIAACVPGGDLNLFRGEGDRAKKTEWPRKFAALLGAFCNIPHLSLTPTGDVQNWGVSNPAVRAYLRRARAQFAGTSAPEVVEMVTPAFLHHTPLGYESVGRGRSARQQAVKYPAIPRKLIPRAWQ